MAYLVIVCQKEGIGGGVGEWITLACSVVIISCLLYNWCSGVLWGGRKLLWEKSS